MRTFTVINTEYWRQGVRESIRRLREWGYEEVDDGLMAEKERMDLLSVRLKELREMEDVLPEGSTMTLVKVGLDYDED